MPSEKHKLADQAYYQKNKDRIKEKSKKWYRDNKQRRIGKVKEYIEKNREKHSLWCKKWKDRKVEERREKAKQAREKNKRLVFDNYGRKCLCCGEAAIEFLTIDHINGKGTSHRKIVSDIYRWLIKNNFPKEFRTLCMNCNFAIGKFGYCPHGSSAGAAQFRSSLIGQAKKQ